MASSQPTSARQFRGTLGDPPRPESDFGSAYDPYNPLLLGESVAARWLRSQVTRIAPYFRTALLRGEPGSGKQLAARAIHALSPVADGPFVVAYASTLAESLGCDEIARQASATPSSPVFESARGGTLYLKGVIELSIDDQTALVRFFDAIEERRIAKAGGSRHKFDRPDPAAPEADLNIRVLAASGSDLRALSAVGQFREDLYAHLSVVQIFIPPLRQRIEDIPQLAACLLHRIAQESGQAPKHLAAATLVELQQRLWPDNLRELDRVVTQAAVLAEGDTIEPHHLLALVASPVANPSPALKLERLQDIVQQHVLEILTRCGGNKVRAAEMLGISRSTLYRMLDAGSVSARFGVK